MKKLMVIIALILIVTLPLVACTNEPTYEELQAAQQEAGQLLIDLGIFTASQINLEEKQVEVFVTDAEIFNKTLEEAGASLPDHVVAVIVYEPLDEIPFDINPDSSVHFPQLRMRSGSFMEALLIGELVLEDGYLRVSGYIIIWQPDYFVHNNNGTIEILDRDGAVVGRVGEEIMMGGGEGGPPGDKYLKEPMPDGVAGLFWTQGGGTRLNPTESSDLFSLEVISAGDHDYYFMKKRPRLDALTGQKETVIGKLGASWDNDNPVICPLIYVETSPGRAAGYTPIWPADYQARMNDGVLEIIDGHGQVVVRDGEEVVLEGRRISGFGTEISKQLHDEIPADCYKIYLIVDSATGVTEKTVTLVEIDWVSFIQFNGINYMHIAQPFTYPEEELEYFDEIRFRLDGNVSEPGYHVKDGDAAYLDEGTQIYSIKGYLPDFRLVARVGEELYLFEAVTNPDASKGVDLLDIEDKVEYIEITSRIDGQTGSASIAGQDLVSHLVKMVINAPVDQTVRSSGEKISIEFHLKDGTSVNRGFGPETGELNRGILLPDDFWELIKQFLP